MRRNPGRRRIYRLAESFKFQKWADCIIGTNAWRLETPKTPILAKHKDQGSDPSILPTSRSGKFTIHLVVGLPFRECANLFQLASENSE